MEGLKKRLFAFGVVTCLFGGFITFAAVRKVEGKAETWLEQQAPDLVDGYSFLRGNGLNEQTYKMDKETYRVLEPYGIVSRVYQKQGKNVDVVLIASNNKVSFHDPRICFSAQGWTLEDPRVVSVETTSRGAIPVSFTKLVGREYQQGKRLAAFFYKGPDGFHANTSRLQLSLLLVDVTGEKTGGQFCAIASSGFREEALEVTLHRFR